MFAQIGVRREEKVWKGEERRGEERRGEERKGEERRGWYSSMECYSIV